MVWTLSKVVEASGLEKIHLSAGLQGNSEEGGRVRISLGNF